MENEKQKEARYPVSGAITDIEELRKIVEVRPEFKKYEEEILKMIADSGAILKGHFVLGPDED